MSWTLAALKLGKHVQEIKHKCSYSHIKFIIKIILTTPKQYHYMPKLFVKKGDFKGVNSASCPATNSVDFKRDTSKSDLPFQTHRQATKQNCVNYMINYFWPLSNSTILKFNCLFQWFTTAVGENETSLNSNIIPGKVANKNTFKSAVH